MRLAEACKKLFYWKNKLFIHGSKTPVLFGYFISFKAELKTAAGCASRYKIRSRSGAHKRRYNNQIPLGVVRACWLRGFSKDQKINDLHQVPSVQVPMARELPQGRRAQHQCRRRRCRRGRRPRRSRGQSHQSPNDIHDYSV